VVVDYEDLFKLPTGIEDIESVFRTERGSTYAHHADATTTRNRSGEKHKDTRSGIQPRSGKTVFIAPQDVSIIGGMFQNPDMATKLVPELSKDGKPTGKVQLVLLEDYGPRKAGAVLAQVPYTTKPQVGMSPVEVYRSESPIGDTGRGVHFGNKITEVHPKPARLGGKAGIAAALVGGAGGANASELAESFLPLGLTPRELAPGTLSPEIKAEYARKRQEERDSIAKAQALLRSGVPMPDNYREGGKVKLI
jgi:hypothetical protein